MMNDIIISLAVAIVYLVIVVLLKPKFLLKKGSETMGDKKGELDMTKVSIYTLVIGLIVFLSLFGFRTLNKPKSSFTYYSMHGMRQF